MAAMASLVGGGAVAGVRMNSMEAKNKAAGRMGAIGGDSRAVVVARAAAAQHVSCARRISSVAPLTVSRSARSSSSSRGGGGVRVAASAEAQTASQNAYNKAMEEYSKTPFEYRHELGLYYHSILPNLIVGTQPLNANDIDRLHDVEGVTCIFDSQQDKDKAYWGVSADDIKWRIGERHMLLSRHPVPDFDADGLRTGMPSAVAALDKHLRDGHTVYCHCTAGMGRSPGVAIGYLFWCHDFPSLDAAYDFLTSKRPCGPKKESIRLATVDMLKAHGGGGNGGHLPGHQVDSNSPEGTTLSNEERRNIKNRLRRSVGDGDDLCDVGPMLEIKKFLGFNTEC
eukprot:CAMPEP_0197586940 /NCGR_PEP_ID=MMETSP1326-20131121/8738_1 /TAXON_ID=1155430 /ORGANISM="Genus nov. species nov., Strain RCC2288" /LENGTH=339 /DNA_ID=CAMNT_0043151613 /DNA_START=110 /DNA_END=1129 /DNA_ORIENTATION=+